MDRRGLLTLLAAGLGGCATLSPDGGTSTETNTGTSDGETPTPLPPVTTATRVTYDGRRWLSPDGIAADDEPFALFVVGEAAARPTGEEPHYVAVESAAARTLGVAVRDRAAGAAALDTEIEFPAGGVLLVELAEPADYDFSVTVDGETTTAEIAASRFDCNNSSTGLLVADDGSVEETSVSTMMGCSTPAS